MLDDAWTEVWKVEVWVLFGGQIIKTTARAVEALTRHMRRNPMENGEGCVNVTVSCGVPACAAVSSHAGQQEHLVFLLVEPSACAHETST